MAFRLADFDDAYANAPHIADGEAWPARWAAAAESFRADMLPLGRAHLDIPYGASPRNRLDLFMPEGDPRGLFVFVHGGFWKVFDKNSWSHFSRGALAHGYAVAVPSYTLCPDIDLSGIGVEIARAIECAAACVNGPVTLAGHSAGGQLVTRMIASGSPLAEACRTRIARVVSISGIHDLRPLMRAAMNEILRIDEQTAVRESPLLLRPVVDVPVFCWVGGAERAEFRRQSRMLTDLWGGLGAATDYVEEPDRHHYDVLDGLADPDHPLSRLLVAPD